MGPQIGEVTYIDIVSKAERSDGDAGSTQILRSCEGDGLAVEQDHVAARLVHQHLAIYDFVKLTGGHHFLARERVLRTS